MLYVFYGERSGVLKKTDKLLEKLFEAEIDLSFEKFDLDNFNIGKLLDLSETESLFGNRSTVILDLLLEEHPEIFDMLESLSRSKNIFIIREEKILKDALKKLEKFSKKIEEVKEVIGKKKEAFNVFSFMDAIGEKNKKNAWILYQKGIFSGLSAEELFWRAVSSIKNLMLVKKANSVDESGLHPFVYKKNKSFSKNFSEEELEKLSENLVIGYHKARRGEGEIETLLEKTLLSL